MKNIVILFILSIFCYTAIGQINAPKGIKVGKITPGTSIITIDSLTQSGTTNIKFWKGSVQMNPLSTATNAVILDDSVGTTAGKYVTGKAFQLGQQSKVNVSDSVNIETVVGNIRNPIWIQGLQAAGSTVDAAPICTTLASGSTASALGNGTMIFTMVYTSSVRSWKGVMFLITVQGSFTGDAVNGLALYKLTGTTQTLVAQTANDPNIWKNAANTVVTVPFTSTYTALPGIYYIAAVYHRSAETTPPAIAACTFVPTPFLSGLCGNNKLYFYLSSQTSFPTPQENTVGTTLGAYPIILLYH